MLCKRPDCLTVLLIITSLPIAANCFAQSSGPQSDTVSGQASQDQPPTKPNPFSKMFSDVKSKLASDLGGGASASGGSGSLPADIEHIFLKAPYDRSKPIDVQYPRVAMTVISSPPNHTFHPLSTMIGKINGCWKVSATVWTSETISEPVGPFDACMPVLLAAPSQTRTDMTAFEHWWLYNARIAGVPESATTGQDRTDGPKPPDNIFPTGIQYVRYFQSGGSQAVPEWGTFEAWFWAAVLYHMDFDPTAAKDRRFWIVKILPAER